MPEVNLHKGQSAVYKDIFLKKKGRFFVAIASRGWGKSYFAAISAMTAVHELLSLPAHIPNKNVYIIAPTYDQVVDIYFPILVYDLEVPAIKISRELGRFVFPNNVELRLISYEAVERLRGKGAYFVVMDEMCSWTKGIGAQAAWEGIIQPAIVTRWSKQIADFIDAPSPGRAITITTPKGYDFVYEMYNYHELNSDWMSYQFDYTTSPFLDPNEIEKIKHTIDPIQFAREYLATFEDSSASVFYCFDRRKHVVELPYFKDDEDIHCCIDFNVGLQCTTFFALRGNQMHFLDEIKGHPDTESLAKFIIHKFPKRKIYAYPDPTGRARKSSAPVGTTDFSILRTFGINVMARKKSPPIVDSVNAVNRKLLTAAGDVDMYFDPRCRESIMSMERTRWVDSNVNTATIDKSENLEHFSDGVRYGTEYLFPITAGANITARGFSF